MGNVKWRARRLIAAVCAGLIVVSVAMFLTVQIGEKQAPGGAIEIINGRTDAGALELPLALFIIGAVGLMLVLARRAE